MPNKLTRFKLQLCFTPVIKETQTEQEPKRARPADKLNQQELREFSRTGRLRHAPFLTPRPSALTFAAQRSPAFIDETLYLRDDGVIPEDYHSYDEDCSTYIEDIHDLIAAVDAFCIRYSGYAVTGSIIVTQHPDHVENSQPEFVSKYTIDSEYKINDALREIEDNYNHRAPKVPSHIRYKN